MTTSFSDSDRPRVEEGDLIGRSIVVGNRLESDATTERIHRLITNYMIRLGVSDDGWDTLYRDPADGRLWEHTYPQSELHGGGPPRLHALSLDQAVTKYHFTVNSRDDG